MGDVNLIGMANGICQRKFKCKFTGRVKMSDKLLPLRQYGRFVPESDTIYLATQFFIGTKKSTPMDCDVANDEVDRMYNFGLRVLEHELSHWYCYHNGIEYHDGTTDFEHFLRKHECITNGNFAHAKKQYAFGRKVTPLYCKGCGKPQFDRLHDVLDIMPLSHCCNRAFTHNGEIYHKYYYYDYKV